VTGPIPPRRCRADPERHPAATQGRMCRWTVRTVIGGWLSEHADVTLVSASDHPVQDKALRRYLSQVRIWPVPARQPWTALGRDR